MYHTQPVQPGDTKSVHLLANSELFLPVVLNAENVSVTRANILVGSIEFHLHNMASLRDNTRNVFQYPQGY